MLKQYPHYLMVVHHKDNIFLPISQKYFHPIQVGRALTDTDLGIDHDYVGDNISHKNGTYCELTAMYTAMNYVDASYYGLMHYRRVFIDSYDLIQEVKTKSSSYADALDLVAQHTQAAIGKRMAEGVDIIVAEPAESIDPISGEIMSMERQYRITHNSDDWLLYEKVVKHMFPELAETFNEISQSKTIHCCNMFVMKRTYYKEYAEILFAVMSFLEKHIVLSNKNKFQKRVFGFIAERFLHLYVTYKRKQGVNVEQMRVLYLEGV